MVKGMLEMALMWSHLKPLPLFDKRLGENPKCNTNLFLPLYSGKGVVLGMIKLGKRKLFLNVRTVERQFM